jgi:hypothetical protein
MRLFRPKKLSERQSVLEQLEKGYIVALSSPGTLPASQTLPPWLEATGQAENNSNGWLGLFDSTPGQSSHMIWKSWLELVHTPNAVTIDPHADRHLTWAAPFRPHTFSGVHFALQAWKQNATVLTLDDSPAATWRTLIRGEVDVLGCSPSFLVQLLDNEPRRGTQCKPHRIMLMDEPLPPSWGKKFTHRFPNTEFLVVHAAAQFGVFMKTTRTDGWFELDSLSAHWPKWQLRNGLLEVARGGIWQSTPIQLEVCEGLVRVI